MLLLVGLREGHLACKKLNGECWRGMVICLERDSDLHVCVCMCVYNLNRYFKYLYFCYFTTMSCVPAEQLRTDIVTVL